MKTTGRIPPLTIRLLDTGAIARAWRMSVRASADEARDRELLRHAPATKSAPATN